MERESKYQPPANGFRTFLIVWACVLLVADLFIKRKGWTAFLAAFGLALTLGLTLLQVIEPSATGFKPWLGSEVQAVIGKFPLT